MPKKDLKQDAATLLLAVWAGIPAEYKTAYARNIWEQFQGAVVVAAYTNNLGKFTNSLCSRFNAAIPQFKTDEAEGVLNGGNDKEILKLFREETVLIVLMARVANEERKQQ